MNIPSIESLLAELDKYKRAYESADRQILSLKEQRNRLTDERDGFGKAYHDAYMKTLELTAELDAALAALREAKEALSNAVGGMGGSYLIWKPSAEQAIATIKKVLG